MVGNGYCILRKMLLRSKRNSISAALEENRADPRRFWRVINEDLGIGKKAGSSSCTKIRSEANAILQNGIFPREWVIGNITPIPKEGDSLDPNNWRPVTILPLPSKLLEKAVHYQLMNYFQNQNLLDERQHGFRKDFSTVTATFKVVKDFFNSYNNGDSTIRAFIDYRRAFETLDHKVLLFKLRKYGLDRLAISWIESYLSTRKHSFFCNGVLSKVTEVPYGVPQGSVLGPLFFIIYVNDLLLGQNKQVSVEMYADDTVIYCSAHDVSIATSLCQSALSVLVEWYENNRLTINKKTLK